jgi:tetratricopeptide repeat protein
MARSDDREGVILFDRRDLAACNNEAAECLANGENQAAAQLLWRALTGCQSLLAPDDPATLTVAGNLGVAWVKCRRYPEGLALLEANLANRARIFGEVEPRTLAARDALGVAYRLAGQLHNALAMAQEVTSQRIDILGPAHRDTLTSRMNLSLAMAASGDIESAAAEITAAISDSEESLGPTHPHTAALLDCAVTIAR